MALADQFQHLKHSINDTLETICEVSCNPSNKSGFCLAPCWEICPSVCVDPFSHHPPLTPPPQNSTSPTKLLVILFTILASASLALFFYFCYAKRRRSRSRPPPPQLITRDFLDEDHGPVLDHPIWYIRTLGLQASVIDSIAVFRYKKGDGLVELTDCSVCLSEFQEDEVLRLLPKCSHAFHIPCIDTWLRSHTNCPVCRAPVILPPPRAPSTEVNSGNSSVSGEPHLDEDNREPQWEIQVQGAGCEMEERLGIEMMERRSISFDSLEASKMSRAIALNSSDQESSSTSDMNMMMRSENQGKELEEVGQGSDSRRIIGGSQRFLRLVGSSPIGRSLQSGPIFLKRSASCYGESSLPFSR